MAIDTSGDVGGVVAHISPTDGEDAATDLRMAIAAKAHHVIVAFDKPITWLALDPDEAANVASLLLQKGNDVRNGRGR